MLSHRILRIFKIILGPVLVLEVIFVVSEVDDMSTLGLPGPLLALVLDVIFVVSEADDANTLSLPGPLLVLVLDVIVTEPDTSTLALPGPFLRLLYVIIGIKPDADTFALLGPPQGNILVHVDVLVLFSNRWDSERLLHKDRGSSYRM